MTSPNKRRDTDLMKLMMSDFHVEILDEADVSTFHVTFQGPTGTAYESGVWAVRVDLPLQYPYKSPSLGFVNRIFHPNVDENSGSVCLDVINQTWSPMFDLVNIFSVFLPQLLRYPNPTDPLNGDAAALMLKDKKKYYEKIRDYVERYASPSGNSKKKDKEGGKEEQQEPGRRGSGSSSSAESDISMDTSVMSMSYSPRSSFSVGSNSSTSSFSQHFQEPSKPRTKKKNESEDNGAGILKHSRSSAIDIPKVKKQRLDQHTASASFQVDFYEENDDDDDGDISDVSDLSDLSDEE